MCYDNLTCTSLFFHQLTFYLISLVLKKRSEKFVRFAFKRKKLYRKIFAIFTKIIFHLFFFFYRLFNNFAYDINFDTFRTFQNLCKIRISFFFFNSERNNEMRLFFPSFSLLFVRKHFFGVDGMLLGLCNNSPTAESYTSIYFTSVHCI